MQEFLTTPVAIVISTFLFFIGWMIKSVIVPLWLNRKEIKSNGDNRMRGGEFQTLSENLQTLVTIASEHDIILKLQVKGIVEKLDKIKEQARGIDKNQAILNTIETAVMQSFPEKIKEQTQTIRDLITNIKDILERVSAFK